MIQSSNKFVLIFAVGILLLSAWTSTKHTSILSAKEEAQQAEFRNLEREKAAFEHLENYTDIWLESFSPIDQVVDRYMLFQMLDLPGNQLSAAAEDLKIQKPPARFIQESLDLGLTEVCITTSGRGFEVSAPSIDALLHGLKSLEARIDTRIGGLRIDGEKGIPRAIISDFCIFLRDPVTSGDVQ